MRYFYSYDHKPICEVWNLGQRVYPPPFMLKRADKGKDDSIYREGDTLDGGSIEGKFLPALGFSNPDSNLFTALLFFIMDVGSDDDYRIIFTIQKILPSYSSQWEGGVIFQRSLVAGGTVLPFPRQYGYPENFQVTLIYKKLAEQLMELAKVIEAFEGLMMDFLWGLTGGWEVKVAAEVTEKYVAREILRRALKYVRPKFLAVVKAYIEAFLKEMAVQVFHKLVALARGAASGKLAPSLAVDTGPITIDQIHWLQSSDRVNQAVGQSAIDWRKCHAEGIKDALAPFLKIFGDSKVATGALRQFLKKCFDQVEHFFFDLGLLTVLKKAEEMISKKVMKTVAEAIADWGAEAAKAGVPAHPQTSEQRIRSLTLSKLTDGTLMTMIIKYFEDNWEKLAKGAIDKAQGEFIKAIRGAQSA